MSEPVWGKERSVQQQEHPSAAWQIPVLPITCPVLTQAGHSAISLAVRFQGAVTRTENINLSFKELQWDLLDLLERAEFSKSISQPAFALKASWKLARFSELGVDTQTEHQAGRQCL